ncbi:neuronal acetylcholine receptor subunit alpha-10 [Nematostella vectensis]|uniref:neuronal acetylcholine receptor subunit alpha-10 n=1 Tax=Nematostella vectensis TaxID=45351 RepID=UPI0020774D71|nr:neuronal acetylcholine receptor subunit alpha-10 [Nematostella vectensis]
MASRQTMACLLFLLLVSFVVRPVTSQGAHKHDIEHKLLNDLFTNYSKIARPVLNKSEAIEVQFDLAYAQLINLNSKDQILQSKVWFRQYWINPFLTWHPEQYGGIESINVDPEMIWKPDVILYNNIGFGETGAIYKFDTKATVKHNGYTEWFAPTEIHSICKIDITFFPFDEQFCKLKFGSWTYTGRQLNFTNKRNSADLTMYTISGEWALVAAPMERHVIEYSCCPDPFIDITFTIHIRRKVLFYMTNLIVPCIVLALLTVFSFHLPPESGERIGLVITILLGLTVFMLVFTENVPRTSEVIPLIGKYAFAVLCVVSMSLLVTCCILRVFNKDPDRKMSKWFRKLIFEILGPVLLMKPPEDETTAMQELKGRAMLHMTKANGSPYGGHQPNHNLSVNLDSLSLHLEANRTSNSHMFHPTHVAIPPLTSNLAQDLNDEKLDELLFYARIMGDHLKDTKVSEFRVGEWRYAAAVLDAAFFWLTFIVILGSTLAFYFMIPRDN